VARGRGKWPWQGRGRKNRGLRDRRAEIQALGLMQEENRLSVAENLVSGEYFHIKSFCLEKGDFPKEQNQLFRKNICIKCGSATDKQKPFPL
jgi:hypothetical protein